MFSISAIEKSRSSIRIGPEGRLATLERLPAAFGWLGVRSMSGRKLALQAPRHRNSSRALRLRG